jgi:hypothetical protein
MWASSFGLTLALLAVSPIHGSGPQPSSLLERLERLPGAPSERVLRLALQARQCALQRGIGRGDLLALIDYTRPSTDRRFWLLDLSQPRIVFHELVAHGRGSGENLAISFSNLAESKQSSLGLFVTGKTYYGEHGRSLRLNGLEPGINDAAWARDIVIHAASYVRRVPRSQSNRGPEAGLVPPPSACERSGS